MAGCVPRRQVTSSLATRRTTHVRQADFDNVDCLILRRLSLSRQRKQTHKVNLPVPRLLQPVRENRNVTGRSWGCPVNASSCVVFSCSLAPCTKWIKASALLFSVLTDSYCFSLLRGHLGSAPCPSDATLASPLRGQSRMKLSANVDPGLINPSHREGGVPFKSDESPLKGDTPPINQPGVYSSGVNISSNWTKSPTCFGSKARAPLH